MSNAPYARASGEVPYGLSAVDVAIGRNVQDRRQELCFSLLQLAKQAAISLNDLQRGELGERRFAAEELLRICHVLGIGPGRIMRIEGG